MPDLNLEPTKQKLFTANGISIPLLGQTKLEFYINSMDKSAVVATDAIEEMILGIDWLQQNHCSWNFGSGSIKMGRRWIKLHSQPRISNVRRIYAEGDYTVPAQSQVNLPVKATIVSLRSESAGWVFEPTFFEDGVFAARTLIANGSLKSAVCFLNLTEDSYKTSKGTLLGSAEPVEL